MLRKILCLLCVLCLCLGTAHAETDEQSASPPALYNATVSKNVTIRSEKSSDSESVGWMKAGAKFEVLAYDPSWLTIRYGDTTGYILRHLATGIKAVSDEIPAYGATFARHVANILKVTAIRAEPHSQSDALYFLMPGTRVAIFSIQDGWAQVIYNRQYGYVDATALEGLKPVAKDPQTARPGSPLAAYCSFYSMSEVGLNAGRIVNIEVSCDYIKAGTIQPGEEFSFNDVAGPFRATRGYQQAPVLINGQSVPGSGGGTCQVSSTLYCAMLALPDIHIVFARPHGASGAVYVPHGVDAAVGGGESINLIFRNDFDFPIRIEAVAYEGVVFTAIIKAE